MMDMAIGVIIGASFNKVIDVLVKKILMPPLSYLTNGINLKDKVLVIALGYGALFEAFLDFLIIGFTIFIVVKFMNKLRNKSQDTKDDTVVTPKDIQLLSDLNDLMKEQNELLKRK
ncbi:UNVERIFIED_CONTAM: hypothetical protein GTU68_012613 [Idotea baltica]|nr:hypothetical protein [Idotea baltica]